MSVEAFVRAKVANIVRDIIRSEDGRHGSAKGDAHAATVSMQSSSIKDLDVTCSTDPEEVAVNNDQIAFFVAGIDRAPLFPRIVLGLRVFGGLNDALIRNILSASQDTINNALPEIRESLRAA
jgi:DNA-directed RNA polymerase specialized sigma24 family protein